MSQTAKWTAKNQSGETAAWAGDGTCTVLGFDNDAQGFGIGDQKTGPAALVEFTRKGERELRWQALVSPSELEQLP